MSHRGWFTLVLRAIGVYFLGSTLSHLVAFFSEIVLAVVQGRAMASTEWMSWTLDQLGLVLQAGFGFYLLFGADRLVTYCLSSVQGLCPRCGNDLRGLGLACCPECGTPVAAGAASGEDAGRAAVDGRRDPGGPAGA